MANTKTESFYLKEDGIHIETNGLKFRIGYEQEYLPFDAAKKWCAERGGKLFSFEQSIATTALLWEINIELDNAGKSLLLKGWYWLNYVSPTDPGCAYISILANGSVIDDHKYVPRSVRAVYALN